MRRLSTRAGAALFVLFCLALVSFERVSAQSPRSTELVRRLLDFPGDGGSSPTPTTGTNTGTSTDTGTDTQQTSTTPTPTPTPTSSSSPTATTGTPTSSNPTTPTSTQSTSSNSDTTSTTPNTSTAQPTNTPTPTPSPSQDPTSNTVVSTSVAPDGQTVVVTLTESGTPSSSSAAPTQTSNSDNSSSGISTSSIIGMSVAGGVALIGVVSFFIWKFTRKRFGDYDDEPIKWPELNMHNENLNYALPTNRAADAGTGAGVGAGLESSSEVNLSRNLSGTAYSASQYSQPSQYAHPAADSAADLYAPGGDPYAVPPLPHLNPNQPYRDDPGALGGPGYYDPYRGPVPQTFNDAASVDSHGPGEAIPMNNLAAGGAMGTSRRTPGPQMTAMGQMSSQLPMAGRQSPGPSLGYGAPNAPAAYSGRASPGPGMVMGGRHSPGPNAAYGGGY
ncbi:hypothetical protein M0805_001738 [Coniferiporia weirii]|nr:hypothetical protein M0805_001738 [Coniferiporia weirii]